MWRLILLDGSVDAAKCEWSCNMTSKNGRIASPEVHLKCIAAYVFGPI